MIVFWVLCALDTITCILYQGWHSIFYPEHAFIGSFLIIIAFYITDIIVDHFYTTKVHETPNLNKENSDIELNDLDNVDENIYEDDEYISTKLKHANHKLVELIYGSPHEAIKYAKFCAKNSQDNNLRVDCYRYLALMHSLEPEDLIEIRNMSRQSVNITKRQLLCDLQYEVFSINPDDDDVENYITHLHKILNKLRKIYFKIVEMISMAQPDDIEICLLMYQHYCHIFERYAKIYTINCPNSQKLSYVISTYFTEINADFNLSVAWRHNFGGIEREISSGDFSDDNIIFGTVNKANSSSLIRLSRNSQSHNFEFASAQNLASQNTLNTIYSFGLRSFTICSFLLIAFVICVAAMRANPPNYVVVAKGRSHNIINKIQNITSLPVNSIVKVTLEAVSSCNSEFNGLVNQTKDLKEFEDFSDYISEFSDYIYVFNVKTTKPNDVSTTWTSKSLYKQQNLTLHTSESSLAILLNTNYTLQCSKDTRKDLETSNDLFNSTIFMNSIFADEVKSKSHRFLVEFKNLYVYVTIMYLVVLAGLHLSSGYFAIYRRKTERNYFWNSLIEIDPNCLEETRKRLINGYGLTNQSSFSKSDFNESENNILGSDELESGSGTSKNDQNLEYKTIDPDKVLSTEKTKRENFIQKMNGTFLYILISVIFYVLWSTLVFCYPFPILTYFDRISYYETISTNLYQSTAAVQQIINYNLIEVMKKNLGEKTANMTKFRILRQFILGKVSDKFGYDDKIYRKSSKGDIKNLLNTAIDQFNLITNLTRKFGEGGFTNNSLIEEATLIAFIDLVETTGNVSLICEDIISYYRNQYDIFRVFNRVIAAFFSLIYLIFVVYRIYMYFSEFSVFKNFLLIIPNNNKQAITMAFDLFSNKKKNDNLSNEVSLSRHIIKQSLNGILMVNSLGIIQDVNNSAISILNRKKEDIIQQKITQILSDVNESNNSNLNQMFNQLFVDQSEDNNTPDNIMSVTKTSSVTEVENTVTIRTGNGNLKLVSCKVIKMTDIKMWGDEMTYAFILRDITEFNRSESELKGAQARVENLLTKIMPKVIATRLMSKSDREDIISCVDKAVIIFIGIHDFVSWCTNKNHEDIMQLLDVIFSKFDRKIAKYPTLVKIKMINGVYMAAAGLFNEVSDRTPVHEAVEFCLACGKWVMERNNTEETKIHLNIGVNYDGPIISGVLGREKPLFDVWGDAVNVSARLETSSYIDTIQMLPQTYHTLPEGYYNAFERNDVFLKGKGTTNTFSIPLPGSYSVFS
ncbi:Adenylate and Guanylate cyclase catalytic domain containing protein [Trichomonas vaginalis G3]|uniref:adenylate cyclase n=1 Tax=Trichomonas vaginalis (strain ATCC PRA-98 / G3) TaxID=412133 RepID=A2F7J9_TRIV3|nr:adenylate cyclase protein [Trichomonas vaginalis G3]EAX99106.1 Adenylate and Guanylate cyclase catalytic domain containing protein [Trichomonas vaginalis G3]KAI5498701.1 adenylate cyclase protein [Trichomonas vaginalis G3]|eukprot:XP_001312036.1 Adenylate and Guanylate cyclase catalytic domain containing protein [Trichomonas vaginalis G3]